MSKSHTDDDGRPAAGSESAATRKPKRSLPRGRKSAPKASAAAEPRSEAPERGAAHPVEQKAPAPQEAPQAERPASPGPEARESQQAHRAPEPASGGAQSGAQQQSGGDRGVSSDGPGPQQGTYTAQADNGGGGGGGGGGHGRGDWQERKFWKHGKHKRGRFGKSWQQGPSGAGPAFPQQPPPPAPAPVYGDIPPASRYADLAALDALAADLCSGAGKPLFLDELYGLTLAELTVFARETEVSFEGLPNRKQLLGLILAKAASSKQPILDRGYIDLTDRGAFIVHERVNYRLYPEDAFLPESLIRRYGLKRGHRLTVQVQAPVQENERCPAVVQVRDVMGMPPEEISKVPPFEELIPYYPLKRILLEAPAIHTKDVSMRAVDILTPIGFGQRGLIVAPPRTGKTILLQNIANSISENSPDVKLILLLVDERPEEVTDFRRHTKGEVVSSTFDESPESHIHCAEMVGEKARRLLECGQHVVILLDSITRLARAYNALASNQGKIMSGGLEATALQKPKRFFGAARNIEGGGSLTIIGTALIDTGSRMDEIIFEEFKGTGNMELHLDRGLVDRRVFPAINIDRSGTRKEELIYHPEELQRIYGLRRAMQGLGPIESMEMLIQRLKKTQSNAEFLLSLSRQ